MMMFNMAKQVQDAPEYAYHLLRSALEKFHKNVGALSDGEYREARLVADKTFALESRVLATPEARDTVIAENKVDAAFNEVAARYTDRDSFLKDLKNNGLDEAALRNALHRELLFDAVMERVSSTAPPVSEVDVQIFYQLHKDRFSKPEQRKARHILITVNPEFAENERMAALQRIHAVAEKLGRNPGRFEVLAKKHSECPTAMEGGRLGEVAAGTLYPELDDVLFAMEEGEFSKVIETEMGFHILWCEKIIRSTTVPFSRARERIQRILQERHRKACQKAWLEKNAGDLS